MRTILRIVCVAVLFIVTTPSCKKNLSGSGESVSASAEEKIAALGFSTYNIKKVTDGYIVEEDIFLSESDLDAAHQSTVLRIAGEEQYRTSNLITALPRTITISLANNLPPTYIPALEEAIRRYNLENLRLKFQHVSDNGRSDIRIVKEFGNFLAAAGFPKANGTPYPIIKMNAALIGYNGNTKLFINHVATIMTHEIGHCIGFRHTDYMNRNFSCGGRNEGETNGSQGAILIPGTPSRPDSASWMLVCLAQGQNRPFNENDKKALSYLY